MKFEKQVALIEPAFKSVGIRQHMKPREGAWYRLGLINTPYQLVNLEDEIKLFYSLFLIITSFFSQRC